MRWVYALFIIAIAGGLLAAAELPQSGLSYSVRLEMRDGQLTCPGWELVDGNSPRYRLQPAEGYILSALDDQGAVIYSLRFALFQQVAYAAPAEFFDENGTQTNSGGNLTATDTATLIPGLIVPYHPDAVVLRISRPDGTPMLDVDVSDTAHLDLAAIAWNREQYRREQNNLTPLDPATRPGYDTDAAIGGLIAAGGAAGAGGAGYLAWKRHRARKG